jgi:hypothetical protein
MKFPFFWRRTPDASTSPKDPLAGGRPTLSELFTAAQKVIKANAVGGREATWDEMDKKPPEIDHMENWDQRFIGFVAPALRKHQQLKLFQFDEKFIKKSGDQTLNTTAKEIANYVDKKLPSSGPPVA